MTNNAITASTLTVTSTNKTLHNVPQLIMDVCECGKPKDMGLCEIGTTYDHSSELGFYVPDEHAEMVLSALVLYRAIRYHITDPDLCEYLAA